MARKVEYPVILTADEKQYLKKHTSSGTHGARTIKRALILLKADSSEHYPIDDEKIAEEVGCSISTVHNIKLRFAKGERLKTIEEKVRMGRPRKIDGKVEAHIIATACSTPPEGRVRWTLQLIADSVVALTETPCSYTTISRTLKKMNLSLG